MQAAELDALTLNIIFELTSRSAYQRPVSVFPGQHIVGR
jgi:hypothetical protein